MQKRTVSRNFRREQSAVNKEYDEEVDYSYLITMVLKKFLEEIN
jgi:hypothetical protein